VYTFPGLTTTRVYRNFSTEICGLFRFM